MKKIICMMGMAGMLCLLPGCKKESSTPNETQSALLHEEDPMGLVFARLVSQDCVGPESGNVFVWNGKSYVSFSQVNVDIQKVQVLNDEHGWLDLDAIAGVYDLLSLQNSLGAVITHSTFIHTGAISKVAITFGNDNSIMIGNESKCLRISQSTVEIPLDATIKEDYLSEIKFGIDICDKIKLVEPYDGEACYVLKPEVTIKTYSETPFPI